MVIEETGPNSHAECPACHKLMCMWCRTAWHQGQTCGEAKVLHRMLPCRSVHMQSSWSVCSVVHTSVYTRVCHSAAHSVSDMTANATLLMYCNALQSSHNLWQDLGVAWILFRGSEVSEASTWQQAQAQQVVNFVVVSHDFTLRDPISQRPSLSVHYILL